MELAAGDKPGLTSHTNGEVSDEVDAKRRATSASLNPVKFLKGDGNLVRLARACGSLMGAGEGHPSSRKAAL
ncbi:hypothetical protein [Streptomyces sp. NPDC010273]|uniref:hypothetical protein n=1 Tax=Streptomyces sp. NPDC010273 TaxID=3364829 RepID=UPI0036F071D1